MSKCVWCHAPHDTMLLLCPTCEAAAVNLKLAKGETPR